LLARLYVRAGTSLIGRKTHVYLLPFGAARLASQFGIDWRIFMTLFEEVQDFLISLIWTLVGICVLGIVGALCWWAWASESLANILTLAGLMAVGAGILVMMLAAWLKITEEKQ